MRLHFYVYPGNTECPFGKGDHKNDYVKAKDNYYNNSQLVIPAKGKQGLPSATLGNTFFHGYSVN
jgi:hypothetical protein